MRVAQIRARLLAWWERSARVFPWRNTRDPYRILVAEALLHRTRADQVVDLYARTLATYPTVNALAEANLGQLHELLHSAGLRWRVDRLADAARYIVRHFAGEIPSASADLESIPGVGHYIAAAVRCFAFGESVAIVDSNVVRVYGRVFAIPITDLLRRDKDFHQLAQFLVDPEHPREFNFALLDLAATICTPRAPRCEQCPIAETCNYGSRVLGLNLPPFDLPRNQRGVPIRLHE
jgi:A/G-specific adenine glycosylase